MSDELTVEEVVADVDRIKNFDCKTLVRRDKLGDLAFEDAVEPAMKLVQLFQKLPTEGIREFPYSQLHKIQNQAKSTFGLFDQIAKFSLSVSDPTATRSQYISALQSAYQPAFNELFPLISYSVARTVDFASLETRGRAAVQAIADEKENILSSLQETAMQAEKVLEDVRKAAAEQGVTQMAKYFGDEADRHDAGARRWLVASLITALVLVAYSVSTLFLSNWIAPQSMIESTQLIASKLLIFGVILYGLIQCVRSYAAHRHNQVTNKHRQNALMTYTTLAEAGNSPELRDAVLQHAAAAIYAPNDSGYLKSEERGYGAQGLLALLPRVTGAGSGPSQV